MSADTTGTGATATAGTGATAPRSSSPEIRERAAWTLPGRLALSVTVATGVVGIGLLSSGISETNSALITVGAILVSVALWVGFGLTPVAPGEARVVQLFGRYAGTIRAEDCCG